jgi:hypothetical protein
MCMEPSHPEYVLLSLATTKILIISTLNLDKCKFELGVHKVRFKKNREK